MRMDRIEVVGVTSVVSFLVAIIVQLWVIIDLPNKLRAEMHVDRVADINANNEILGRQLKERDGK